MTESDVGRRVLYVSGYLSMMDGLVGTILEVASYGDPGWLIVSFPIYGRMHVHRDRLALLDREGKPQRST